MDKVNPEYIIRNYVIGKTDLDDSHGQVELIHKVNGVIVGINGLMKY
jgi:hypothetical protein